MSIEKMTDIEKGKLLWQTRKKLHFNQKKMADLLKLDSTYLSQLENGHRHVDTWYVQRAQEMMVAFGKSAPAKPPPAWKVQGMREKSHEALERVLDACHGDDERLAWTYVELVKHFPVSTRILPAPGAGGWGKPVKGKR
jgi:transcriptional regulator with XRE-family HTH domain